MNNTDLKFFTNEPERDLYSRFAAILKSNTQFFDVLVGYFTAVLNSTLMSFYYTTFYNSMSLAGGFYRIGAPQIKTLPIAIPNDENKVMEIEEMVDNLQKMLSTVSETDPTVRRILKDIDKAIYDAYGLSKEEIHCIEG